MAISRERAVELMRRHAGDIPAGARSEAWPIGATDLLWVANVLDANGMPRAGAATLIGPDERFWVLSSNPSIHDLDLAVRLLEDAYHAELTNYLDADRFAERIAEITQRRADDLRAFQKDLRAGSMRRRVTRQLP